METFYLSFDVGIINLAYCFAKYENNVLTIEGKSEQKTEVDEKNYYRKEVRCGSFHRSVALPTAVDASKAKAEYEEGMLKIRIPKDEKELPKSIKVDIKKK